MTTKRPVIIFSYWFAPSPAVGGKRFSFLAREFARLGYDVHVITHEAHEWIDYKADGSLPLAGQVHRCGESLKLPLAGKGKWRRLLNTMLYRLLAPVGFEIFWADVAARKALEVARPLRSGVVIATSPAPAALIAGARVARRLDWPLILDYRDPWSAHAWPRWRVGAIGQWFARRFERRVVRRSAARVLNTAAMRASFEKAFPRSEIPRNFVIPNGFEAVAEAAPPPPADGPVFIVHAGEIYTGRSLVPVLLAVQRLQARHPDRPIKVITFGGLPPVEQNRIREQQLESWIEVRPRVPFAELFAELQRAHLLKQIEREVAPQHRGHRENAMALRRQRLQATLDDAANSHRYGAVVTQGSIEIARRGQEAHDFHNEERVPLGALMHRRNQRGSGGSPGQDLDQARHG